MKLSEKYYCEKQYLPILLVFTAYLQDDAGFDSLLSNNDARTLIVSVNPPGATIRITFPTAQDVENIFMSVTSRLQNQSLTMSGFMLTIIKLSVCKYSKKQVKESVEDGGYHTVKKGHSNTRQNFTTSMHNSLCSSCLC